jgi:hypothetical protein
MTVYILSAAAVAVCLGIAALLICHDIQARRELRRTAYKPRHLLAGEDTVAISIPAVEAALTEADRVEVAA